MGDDGFNDGGDVSGGVGGALSRLLGDRGCVCENVCEEGKRWLLMKAKREIMWGIVMILMAVERESNNDGGEEYIRCHFRGHEIMCLLLIKCECHIGCESLGLESKKHSLSLQGLTTK